MEQDGPTPEELARREAEEAAMAEDADLPEAELTHERRADKAAYLREKLQEQREADAERD